MFFKEKALQYAYSHSAAHLLNSWPVMLAARRLPASTLALGANFCIFSPELPIELPPEVAKGTIVWPVKA